jgi:hypothetical protein
MTSRKRKPAAGEPSRSKTLLAATAEALIDLQQVVNSLLPASASADLTRLRLNERSIAIRKALDAANKVLTK